MHLVFIQDLYFMMQLSLSLSLKNSQYFHQHNLVLIYAYISSKNPDAYIINEANQNKKNFCIDYLTTKKSGQNLHEGKRGVLQERFLGFEQI